MADDTENYINKRYSSNNFINSPKNRSSIKVLRNIKYNDELPYFSIIMPIYNQELIVVKHIQSIIDNTTEKNYEIILILDSCSDNTEANLLNWVNSEKPSILTKLLILKSEDPLFETAADNLGFLCGRGKYLLEIQADMEMTERGYNMKLLKPFLQNTLLIGISGRCCHDYACTIGIGKLGHLIEKNLSDLQYIDRESFYVGETCNRGPLLLDNEKLKELGYLDEENYFLDNSDHDLFARAYYQKGYICGYVPIDFISLLKNGSTRLKRDDKNEQVYQNLKRTKTGINGFLQTVIKKTGKRDIRKYKLVD
jgi:glycosyltransferase involved in cell wall biosynthesis